MTREEAIKILKSKMDGKTDTSYEWAETVRMAISALSENKGDLISRQAVIDLVSKFIVEIISEGGRDLNAHTNDVLRQILRNISSDRVLPSIENKGEWIPVSERLPKPYEQVLRTVKSIGWNGASYIDVDLGTICPIDTDVIAWMPLPEPYKAESEGK